MEVWLQTVKAAETQQQPEDIRAGLCWSYFANTKQKKDENTLSALFKAKTEKPCQKVTSVDITSSTNQESPTNWQQKHLQFNCNNGASESFRQWNQEMAADKMLPLIKTSRIAMQFLKSVWKKKKNLNFQKTNLTMLFLHI